MEQSPNAAPDLTSGRLLARNSLWNMLSLLLPLAVGVVAVPPLIRGMGVARFGLLSLAWIVIGYFSLFDLGIGRALTKLIADKIGAGEEQVIPPLAWTSLLLMLILGIFAGLTTLVISPWLVHRVLRIPETLQAEALRGFWLLATSIPLVTLTSGLRGILEAQQKFRVLSIIRIPMSIFSFAGPLLVMPFSHGLVPVIAVLVAGRLLGCIVHVLACLRSMPALGSGMRFSFSLIAPLLRFGSWMTVSNLVSPVIVYMDRFLIGALVSMSAVAAYTAPFDLVNRLIVVPGAVAGVLFPAFALSLAQDPNRTAVLLGRGVKYLFLAIFPVVLLIVVFAPEGLRLWLGGALTERSSLVLRWLAAGIFANCLAQLPFSLLQSAGHPDLTAKIQLFELPPYLLFLVLLVKSHGIEGAAIAWTVRVIVDAVVLFFFACRLLPRGQEFLWRLVFGIAAALLIFYVGTLPHALAFRSGFVVTVLLVFGVASWFWAFSLEERTLLLRLRPALF
jgi:O-antigen/teichoic acid export membrane protein